MIHYRNIATLVNLGNDGVRSRCAMILNLFDFVTQKRRITEGAMSISHPTFLSSQLGISQTLFLQADNS